MAFLTPTDIISGSASLAGGSAGLWGWAALAGLALSTSAVILAFLYVWAALFRNPQLYTYVKQELMELFISGILVIFILGAVAGISDLRISILVPKELLPSGIEPDTNIYEATAAFYKQVDDDISGWLNMNYVMNIYVDQVASVTPYARPLGVGLVASPMAGFASPLKQVLYNMSVTLSIAFVINHAQAVVYLFALDAFLKFYLPAGIFLRCFTPTRRIGGTLIGVALAFLFFFPAISVISYCMLYNSSMGPLVSFNTMLVSYISDTGAGGFQGVFTRFFGNSFSDAGSSVTGLMSGVFGSIGTLFKNLVGTTMLTFLMVPASCIAWAFVIGFILPTFNVLLFTQAARDMSKILGEEVDVTSLTRMI